MSRKIAGYRLEKRLGQGSMTAVYLARDERLRYQLAVKVVAPDPDRDPAFASTLIRESRAAAAMDHPHIIPVYDAGEEDGSAYVVMRYARGGDARSLLRRLGSLPLEYAWRIIAQVASALDAAHAQGLIHRDVKPANILFDGADTARPPGRAGDRPPGHAYLSDFGMGRVFPPGLVTAADQITDSLDYLAPEQIQGDVLDGRADLYALACTSYELLCGAPPFGAEQGLTLMYSQLYAPPPVAAARRAGLPAAADPVLARALAKDPADRYPSCGRFAAELRAALGLGSVLRAGPAPSRGPTQLSPVRPSPTQPGPSQPGSTRAGRAQSGPVRPGRRVPAGLAGSSMLIAPAPGDFTPAPLTGDFTPPAPLTGDFTPAASPAGAFAPTAPVAADWSAGPPDRSAGPPAWLTGTSDWPAGTAEAPAPAPGAGPPAGSPRTRRGLRAALTAAIVAVVIVAVAVGFVLSKRPASGHPAVAAPAATPPISPTASSPPSPPLASQQAAALDTLLISSSTARTALHRAVKEVGTCANLAGAISDLQNVVKQRAGEYSRASALTVSALPDGAKVKAALTTALSRSLKADQDYLTWARQQRAGGCTPSSQSSTYNAAFSASQRADTAKQAFVQVWNPVAARYGLAQNSPRNI